MQMRRRRLISLAAVVALALPWAGGAQASGPLRVLATTGMIGDLVAAVGGDCVLAEVLIGPGSDPHLYQPRPSDIARLQGAEVLFHHGLGLEGRLGQVLDRLARDGRPVQALAETAVPADLLLMEDGAADPHLWMDVGLWAVLAPEIATTLGAVRPDCAGGFSSRAGGLQAELAALDSWARDSLVTIPEDARVLVTAHDAFGYFARAYGVEQVAIQGFSTESEASVADLREVAQVVAARAVPVVFVESTISPRTVQAMLEAVAALGGNARIGGSLFSDAMGEAGTPEGTYIGMIRANVLVITEGLGGTPAPWPDALVPWAVANGIAP